MYNIDLERKELVLHLVFEIELFSGIEGTLYADKLGIWMIHEVIYSLVIEIGIDSDVGCFDAIGGFIYPILGEL